MQCRLFENATIGLGKSIAFKRFAVQILLWSLEFVIYHSLEYDTIAASNLAQSYIISTNAKILSECLALQILWKI